MKFYSSLDDISIEQRYSAITVGMFDGVHKGHLAVLDKLVEISRREQIPSIVLTFSNHPSSYFKPDSNELQLCSLEEKKEKLRAIGIDILIAIPFNEYIAKLTANQFADNILIRLLQVKFIVFGYDNHFGYKREGSKEFIDLHYPTINSFRVEETIDHGEIISSSLIKSYLVNGELEKVSNLLNYGYKLKGKVIKGDQLGRTIGFPTANIDPESGKLIPKLGVYFTRSNIKGKEYYGMTNIGYRPTVTNKKELRIETNLFNFNFDIYDEILEIEFISRMRDEMKFDSLPALINQLAKDQKNAEDLLAQIHVAS